MTKKRFAFSWKDLDTTLDIYVLQIEDENDILGVMGLIYFPEEARIEIKLIANAKEHIGKNKGYDRIAGCLIAFAVRLAVSLYGPEACLSLVPKTELKHYYIKKYNMKDGGWQLYLDEHLLQYIINTYS